MVLILDEKLHIIASDTCPIAILKLNCLEGWCALYYRDLLAALNDLRGVKCEKCGSPLELYRFSLSNLKSEDVNANVLMVCFKCRLMYDLIVMGRGVIGVKDVKNVDASSWSELLESSGGLP
jgi:hypothetical protein